MNESTAIAMPKNSDISLPEKADLPALFKEPGAIEKIIVKIEAEARSHVADISSDKGRKAIISLASKVTKSKTLIDSVGKDENEERLRLNKEVNNIRNMAKDRLDDLRDEIRKPVSDWEAGEVERKRALEIRMALFELDQLNGLSTSTELKALLEKIEGTPIDDSWDEYEKDATKAKVEAATKYTADLGVAENREAQELELAKLRAESDERAKKDAEQAEQARKVAAEKEEVERLERQKAEADERAKADADRETEELKQKHEQELQEAKQREEDAAQTERDKLAAERKAAEVARAKRAADEQHRARIIKEVTAALKPFAGQSFKVMIEAMIDGKVPYIEVKV